MQALSDDQQIERLESRMDRFETRMDRLETKIDNGLGAARSEARADFRTLLAVQLSMFVVMILGFAGILLQHHL